MGKLVPPRALRIARLGMWASCSCTFMASRMDKPAFQTSAVTERGLWARKIDSTVSSATPALAANPAIAKPASPPKIASSISSSVSVPAISAAFAAAAPPNAAGFAGFGDAGSSISNRSTCWPRPDMATGPSSSDKPSSGSAPVFGLTSTVPGTTETSKGSTDWGKRRASVTTISSRRSSGKSGRAARLSRSDWATHSDSRLTALPGRVGR